MTCKERLYKLCIPDADRCWRWTGYKQPNGYGRFQFNGKSHLAHRVSWMIFRGPIPIGMQVCHICDNPDCVAPRHLFIGTQKDNLADMSRKGRGTKNYGEKSGMAKLTAQQVNEIHRLKSEGAMNAQLASRFGVQKPCIQKIVTGQRWPHLYPKGSDPSEWPEDLRVRQWPEGL